ncbi:hypothetical protein MTO96_049364 [Rhipicephalus appendiculatus]
MKLVKLVPASGSPVGPASGDWLGSGESSKKGRPPKVRGIRVKQLKQVSASGSPDGPDGTWFASGESSNERPMAKVRGTVAGNFSDTSDTEQTLFIRLLVRIICSEIVRSVPDADKKCSQEPGSAINPDWNYGWYKSVGVELLTMAVDPKKNLRRSPSAESRRRTRSPSWTTFSLSYGLPAAFDDNFTVLSKHQADLYGDELESFRLLRFLTNSTWKLWLGITRRDDALGTAARISQTAPSLIAVPEPVFNLTALKDPWLRLLAAARYTPRILAAVLRRRNQTEKLMSSPFGQCASKYFATPDEYDDGADSTRRIEAYLGAFELAAFHTALDIYRSGVGERAIESVPGTDLNGASFFLFYYVFNECEVVSSKSSARNLDVPRRSAVSEATMETRRNYFPKISNLLAKIMLPGCKAPGVQFTGCGTVAAKYDNNTDNATANAPQ